MSAFIGYNEVSTVKGSCSILESGESLVGGWISPANYGYGTGNNCFGCKIVSTLYSKDEKPFRAVYIAGIGQSTYNGEGGPDPVTINVLLVTNKELNLTRSGIGYYIATQQPPTTLDDNARWNVSRGATLSLKESRDGIYIYYIHNPSVFQETPTFGGYGGISITQKMSSYDCILLSALYWRGSIAAIRARGYVDGAETKNWYTSSIYNFSLDRVFFDGYTYETSPYDPYSYGGSGYDSYGYGGYSYGGSGYYPYSEGYVEHIISDYSNLYTIFTSALTNVLGDSKVKVNNNSFEIWEEANVRNFQLGHYKASDVPTSPFAYPPESPAEVVAIFKDSEDATKWALLHSHQLLFRGGTYSSKLSPMTLKIMDNATELDSVLIQQDVIKIQDGEGNSAALRPGHIRLNESDLIQYSKTDIAPGDLLATGCIYVVYED